MSLYGILGVQFFGRMDYHCMMIGTDPKFSPKIFYLQAISTPLNFSDVTIADFAIPDTFCSLSKEDNCPENMKCTKINISAADEGYYGMFNTFSKFLSLFSSADDRERFPLVYSVFSVYMAASQEGWVYVMYDCIDSLPSWKAFVYFTTLIFFLAWLVKVTATELHCAANIPPFRRMCLSP